MIRVAQKVVGIAGMPCALRVWGKGRVRVRVASWPSIVSPLAAEAVGDNQAALAFECRSVGSGRIELEVEDAQQRLQVPVAARVFRNKEFFVCLVQSSNVHVGWDPRPTAQYFDGQLVTFDTEEGYHAFQHARRVEGIFHGAGKPVTWLIDETVARENAPLFRDWHWRFGDDYALLPRSYFYQNKRNLNLQMTAEAVTELLAALRAQAEAAFAAVGHPYRTRVAAADQWVGAVGSNFVLAANALQLEGFWGIGYDHRECDTSMYHRGTPWDVYKPNPRNFRCPRAQGRLWCFQWTTRDILNTLAFSPNGSTVFSTDPDDVRHNLIADFQPDYYLRLLREYQRNMKWNDFFVFLLHQEDHDSHIEKSNDVLRTFIGQIQDDASLTFATLEEVSAWLNLKYGPNEHPRQVIEMQDPLTCRDLMREASRAGRAAPMFAENSEWGQYGTHLGYYGPDAMWIAREPEPVPAILYDYTKADIYPFAQDGEYPQERTPEIRGLRVEAGVGGAILHFDSSDAAENLPLVIWHPSEAVRALLPAYVEADAAVVVRIPRVSAGKNVLELRARKR